MEPEEPPEGATSQHERRVRTLTEKGNSLYEQSQQKLYHELEQTWIVVQQCLLKCEQCPNDIIELRKAEKNLSSSFNKYCHASSQYDSFLTRTNTGDSLAELEQHKISHEKNNTKVEQVMTDIDKRVEILLESASQKSHSSRKSAHTNKSSISSAIAKTQAKAEAAKAQATYALQEAELRKRRAIIQQQEQVATANAERQKADLETELELLQHHKNVASAEAELKVMQSANNSSNGSVKNTDINVPSVDPKQRTKDYINKLSVHGEQDITNENKLVSDIPNNIHFPSVQPVSSHNIHETTSQFPEAQQKITSQYNPHAVHINSARNMTLTDQNPFVSCLDPNAVPYTPTVNEPAIHHRLSMPGINQNTSTTTELAQFLLKKDLLLTRLTKFDDKPESYALWKSIFINIMVELGATVTEELDLLIRWLGSDSSRQAQRIRAANVRYPDVARQRIWDRLEERYGRPEMVEAALKSKLEHFPKISNKEPKRLYDLVDILCEIQSMKEDPCYSSQLSYFDSSSGVIPIVNKLPYNLQERWTTQAVPYKKQHHVSIPPFHVFVDFISEISQIRNDPSFVYEQSSSNITQKTNKPMANFTRNYIATKKTDIQQPTTPTVTLSIDPAVRCPLHNTKHPLNECRGFRQKPLDERKQIIKEFGVCYKCCASVIHQSRDCKAAVTCSVCSSSKHATALHVKTYDYQKHNFPSQDNGGEKSTKQLSSEGTNISTKCTEVCGGDFKGKSCGKTIQVIVYPKGEPHNGQHIYAILDDQSNASLGSPAFFDLFPTNFKEVPYTLSSCTEFMQASGRKGIDFVIESLDGTATVCLPSVIECGQIPNVRDEIPTPEVALHHPHLHDIAQFIPPINENAQILLLIGRDVIETHHVLDQRIGPSGSPYAQQLPLGWVIIGETCLGTIHRPNIINVNKTYLLDNGRASVIPPCPNIFDVKQKTTSGNELSHIQYPAVLHDHLGENVFEITRHDNKLGMSIEDHLFTEIMDKGSYKEEGGNWSAPLPFREIRPRLPNNRPQALKRAKSLHNSLQKDSVKKEHFVTFMKDIFDRKHAEIAPPLNYDEECWYLPLFGVYHPKKPHQIRGVFDSSAQYMGLSLNNVLLTGPDLTNSLLGILLRFRREPVAITGDVQHMFHCFLVHPDHRNFLRFFWYENNNTNNDLIEYRMRVHVFGNCASPAVATYGIRRAAQEGEKTFGSDVKNFVKNDFYVDDALTSLPTAVEAIDLMKRTQQALLTEGNIRLHKIASNDIAVMESFPSADRAKDLKDLDLGSETLPLQRSLGLYWDLTTDTFRFQVNTEDKPLTKRGVLSTINSLFDPLGFVSPVLIHGRILLRQIMTEKTDWDDPLPAKIQSNWEEWRDSLSHLDNLQIPRTYSPSSLQAADSKELYVFSDASEQAIAAVIYLKVDNHVGFVLGKTKVAPSHGHTIPRLELCAAVLAVELAELVCDHLHFPMHNVHFYTDNKIVLGYVHNQTRRFYVYVANRIATIRRSTNPQQWQYIHTKKNPADQATRSITASSMQNSLWLTGPSTLGEPPDTDTYPLDDPDCDKEIRSAVVTLKTKTETFTGIGLHRFERFSSWKRLVHAIATLKRLANTYHKTDESSPTKEQSIRDYYLTADKFIIKEVQRETYPTEIAALQESNPLSKNSSILPLNPTLDSSGLLIVGGRLNQSNLEPQEQNPWIIPSRSHIATLLVRHHHMCVQHQGRHLTEGAVRTAGLWIIGGKRLISSVIHQCAICRKLRGKLAHQQMADLPADRTTPAPPFTFVGVDAFGPWTVVTRRTRGGQSNSKRWGIIFTCLSTRAIHIEVVEEMSSPSFINSLRRFVSIRGNVREFRSDRGTNFVGCTDSLQINAVNVEDTGVNQFLYDKGSQWIFNPLHASHMGGVWERMIGLTRKILDSMLLQPNTRNLTHEVLCTFLAEVSAIVNARPLVPVSSDPEFPMILSPATLLTQRTNHVTGICENLDVKDIYRAQWKHVQFLAENFWKRWRSEYLQMLQPRRKWMQDQPDLKPGDIVLLKDKDVHRNQWPTAIVNKVFPSADNKIRKVEIRVRKDGKSVLYTRPITELVVLLSE